ncbi:metallopeptidase TldD-related protein [Paraclostridium sp. AKS81]|uniref:metallopeptidase TldD-related protein n=1 Tax=Paraclostridium sp. AKS81 TaxID=2876117 RepID=UPI002FCD1A6D
MVTDFAGLHSGANSITGDFSLAAKGYYITKGEKSYPIEQITVAGNFFELIKDIENIGNDLKFPLSNIGSPSVIIKSLSIAGK